jgi:hypothetical protein
MVSPISFDEAIEKDKNIENGLFILILLLCYYYVIIIIFILLLCYFKNLFIKINFLIFLFIKHILLFSLNKI